MPPVSHYEPVADELIGASPTMARIREHVHRLAHCDVSVLLQGESGTGKEVVARTIHRLSPRRNGPFIGVNCAAINETLLESELFGHEAGAFTGAQHATLGFLRAADTGTILLDEIGDMPEALQSSLLRVLEERAVIPVGGVDPIPIDIRVIAASHLDLAEAVAEGSFRQDLYYRLNVVCLSIPPLRERRQDIPVLTSYLTTHVAELLNVEPKAVSSQAMRLFLQYHWPGNVRQLSNVIQHAYIMGSGDTIDAEDFPTELLDRHIAQDDDDDFVSLNLAIRGHVEKALEISGGTRTEAARLLGIDRKSLWRMMRRHGLE